MGAFRSRQRKILYFLAWQKMRRGIKDEFRKRYRNLGRYTILIKFTLPTGERGRVFQAIHFCEKFLSSGWRFSSMEFQPLLLDI